MRPPVIETPASGAMPIRPIGSALPTLTPIHPPVPVPADLKPVERSLSNARGGASLALPEYEAPLETGRPSTRRQACVLPFTASTFAVRVATNWRVRAAPSLQLSNPH